MSRLAWLALILAPRISNAFTVRHTRTNLTWSEICDLERQRAVQAARRATPNARLVAKHLQEWREITRRGLPAHLATDAALRHEGHGGSGMGSGSTTLALAAALCDSVDAYGFGAYRGRGGAFAYIHFYDEEPWLGDAKGGELVFAAELRNALFDALGVFRWVWW